MTTLKLNRLLAISTLILGFSLAGLPALSQADGSDWQESAGFSSMHMDSDQEVTDTITGNMDFDHGAEDRVTYGNIGG